MSLLFQSSDIQDEPKYTIRYLNHHRAVAIFIFTLVIIGSSLWSEFVITMLSKHVFRLERSQMTVWMWLISAVIFTVATYYLTIHIFKVPITAAYP